MDWHPSDTVRIKSVTFDNGQTAATVPERFYLILQSPAALKASTPTAIVVVLAAGPKGVKVVHFFGVGDDWLTYLDDVVAHVPGTEWVRLATKKAVAFMLDRSVLRELDSLITALDLPAYGAAAAFASPGSPGIQQRRKITPEHLQMVAATYEEAQRSTAPPTRAVADVYEVSHSTAAKWIGKARAAGYLPPFSPDKG